MLERARDELAVVGKKLYFNPGWSGPSPWRVIEEQKRVLDWLSVEGVSHHIYGKLKEYVEVYLLSLCHPSVHRLKEVVA